MAKWLINNGQLERDVNNIWVGQIFIDSYPKLLFNTRDGQLKLGTGYSNLQELGAFAHSKLSHIDIPETTLKLGDNVFTHSLLKSVQIPKDCKYTNTTFPKNCNINFYEN